MKQQILLKKHAGNILSESAQSQPYEWALTNLRVGTHKPASGHSFFNASTGMYSALHTLA